MKDIVELLETLGFPVYRQGSLNPEKEFPSAFFTYWNFETPESGFYDNEPTSALWGYWVYCYSDDADTTYSLLEKARKLLKENDFILDGKGEDAPSGAETHTGRMFTAYFIEKYRKEE